WNGYAYSNNNPINTADPSGLQLEECASGLYRCSHGGTQVEGPAHGGLPGGCSAFAYVCGIGSDSTSDCSTNWHPPCAPITASNGSGKITVISRTPVITGTDNGKDSDKDKGKKKHSKGIKDSVIDGSLNLLAKTGVVEKKKDPHTGTYGFCISAGASAGIAVNGSACLTRTYGPDGEEHGNLLTSAGTGLGGFGIYGSADTLFSNADDVSQLSGWGGQLEVTAGEGLVGHGAVGTGGSKNSKGDLVVTGMVGVGAGLDYIPPVLPVNVTGGVSYTWVHQPFGNR
ncbi:hypothetical protein, partial [Kitasatospora sp. MBT63]